MKAVRFTRLHKSREAEWYQRGYRVTLPSGSPNAVKARTLSLHRQSNMGHTVSRLKRYLASPPSALRSCFPGARRKKHGTESHKIMQEFDVFGTNRTCLCEHCAREGGHVEDRDNTCKAPRHLGQLEAVSDLALLRGWLTVELLVIPRVGDVQDRVCQEAHNRWRHDHHRHRLAQGSGGSKVLSIGIRGSELVTEAVDRQEGHDWRSDGIGD